MDTNPAIVQRLANKFKLGEVLPSTRKDKKYMVLAPTGKYIHFGAKGYKDYTSHRNPARLANFQKRNARWKNAPTYTPAWLAYHLLWNDSI